MSGELRDAVSSGSQTEHPMLRRRVLTLDEFARETRATRLQAKAEYGAMYVPIPVPLALGETEDQYEAAFRAYTEKAEKRKFAEIVAEWDASKERQRRCTFAMHRQSEFKLKHGKRKTMETDSVDDFEMPPRRRAKSAKSKPVEKDEKKAPAGPNRRREELYVKRFVDLDEHRRLMREGYFNKVKVMTAEEKMREFGSEIVPIFVPLARGETPELYEERFIQWVWETEKLSLEALVNDRSPTKERHYRMLFAQANNFGHERYVPPRKHERSNDEEPRRDGSSPKKHKDDAARDREKTSSTDAKNSAGEPAQKKGSCTGEDSIASVIACGCRRCLVKGKRLMATKIEAQTRQASQRAGTAVAHVVDLTSDVESLASGSGSPSRPMALRSSPGIHDDDPIETKLLAAYDAINEQIVMNENVLDASATRLLTTPVNDIKETTQIQDEDQEMRELIREEMKNRSMALARLIVYVWRHKVDESTKMVNDSNASDVIHVQRAVHHKCAQLAAEWATKRQATLRATPDLNSDATFELQRLHDQRRREFVKLVYFDQHIRQLIAALLKKSANGS